MDKFHKYIESNGMDMFLKIAVPIADYLAPIKYSPNGSYDNKYFLICLSEFVKNHVHMEHYMGKPYSIKNKCIKGHYLNQIHNKYVKCGVYDAINKKLLETYLKKGRSDKIKIQIIDSTYIPNKRGSVKNQTNNYLLSDKVKLKNIKIRENNKICPKKERKKEETFIDFNSYNGRKKYFKVSTITNKYGIPLGSAIISSKQSDSISVNETVDKINVQLNTLKNSKINRYKQYILADALYDSKKNMIYLEEKGYIPIIDPNKRNTKNEDKLREKELLKEKNKKIYKKRRMIESFFSWIKNYAVINQCYEKTISSYNGLFSLASSIIISKHI
jgi:hypothetical protein